MLNPLADVASSGETVVAVWVWGPSSIATDLSFLVGGTGPPGDAASAASLVQTALQVAPGVQIADTPAVFSGPSALYIGCSFNILPDGDGKKYGDLLAPLANLGGFFTAGVGPILSFVDYGNSGEPSGPLAQKAALADDTGQLQGGLTPVPSINGIADAIDSLGAETPYFQAAFKGQVVSATTVNNQVIAPAAGAAQSAAQKVKDAATGAAFGITGVLVALILAEVFLR